MAPQWLPAAGECPHAVLGTRSRLCPAQLWVRVGLGSRPLRVATRGQWRRGLCRRAGQSQPSHWVLGVGCPGSCRVCPWGLRRQALLFPVPRWQSPRSSDTDHDMLSSRQTQAAECPACRGAEAPGLWHGVPPGAPCHHTTHRLWEMPCGCTDSVTRLEMGKITTEREKRGLGM